MPDRRVFWFLVTLAVGVRAGVIGLLGSHTVPHSTYEHGEIATNLLAGRGFAVRYLGADGPTSQQAPLYPVVVAGAYWLGGGESPRSLLILELGQAALGGVLVAAVVGLTARLLPGSRWGPPLAGTLVALDPALVYAASHVQVVALATTLLVLALAAGEWAGRTGRVGAAVGAGLILGTLALTDPILALAAPAVAWSIARGVGDLRRACWLVGVVALVAASVVAPWVARNGRVHGEFVPVKSSFGYAFWQGNNPLSQGTDKVIRPSAARIADRPSVSFAEQNRALWEARHEAGYIDDIALTAADYRTLGALTEPERGRTLFRRAIANLQAHPLRYPQLCLQRLRFFFLFDETNPKTRSRIYRVSHLGLTGLAIVGLILARPDDRRRLGPTLLVVGLVATFHSLTIVSARFHLPIEPLMAIWAASGLARWDRVRADTGEGQGSAQPRLPTTS